MSISPLTPEEEERKKIVFARVDKALAGAWIHDPGKAPFSRLPQGWRRSPSLWRVLETLLDVFADTDADTNLRTKNAFAGYLSRLVKNRAKEEHPQPCSIVILDINNFKSINDDLGHVCGDYFLAAFADVLRKSTRQNIKEKRIPDVIARLGGDEFALILPNTTQEQAVSCMSNILNKIRATTFVFPQSEDENTCTTVSNMSFSYGCYELRPEISANEAIGLADDILYAHKERFREKTGTAPRFKTISMTDADTLTGDVIRPEQVEKWVERFMKKAKREQGQGGSSPAIS
jgi:diguanylate cyclase (GGDEF)-like protein